MFSRNKPKIKVQSKKRDGFSGWIQCNGCAEMIHANEIAHHCHCCPKCEYHYRLPLKKRIDLLTDKGSFQEKFTHIHPSDPLEFVDEQPYQERIQKAQEKTQNTEAILVGEAEIRGKKVAFGVMDFSFMGGSMGSVVGEKLTLLIEHATKEFLPLVLVCASGGARMQESIYSLMQMAKTSAALRVLHEQGLPFLSILTNPTTGGVTASFASLGDIIIAEPNALIAFAGPRVVEQTIKQKLPENAQKSEFLQEKGMVDCIVPRKALKETIAQILQYVPAPCKQDLQDDIPEKFHQLLSLARNQVQKKKRVYAERTHRN